VEPTQFLSECGVGIPGNSTGDAYLRSLTESGHLDSELM